MKKGSTGSNKPRMKIVRSLPPKHVYDGCKEAFELSGYEIWCYGNKIHNPNCSFLSKALIAHEATHRDQQGDYVDQWWERYLKEPEFRLQQELEAHIVEYRVFCLKEKNSKRRASYLKDIGDRLSSPTYGSMIPAPAAMNMVKRGKR